MEQVSLPEPCPAIKTPSVIGFSVKILDKVSTNSNCGGDNVIDKFKCFSSYRKVSISTGWRSHTSKTPVEPSESDCSLAFSSSIQSVRNCPLVVKFAEGDKFFPDSLEGDDISYLIPNNFSYIYEKFIS